MERFIKYIIAFLTLLQMPSINSISQQDQADSLRNILFTKNLNDSAKVIIFFNLNEIYANINIDSSKLYLQKALCLSKSKNLSNLYAKALLHLGNYFNRINQYDSMKYYYNHSLYISKQNQWNHIISNIYNGYGVYHLNKANYDTALVFEQHALRISESIKDTDIIHRALNNIGMIHYYLKNYDKALDYYSKSLEIKKQLHNLDGTALLYNNIGIVYYHKGEIFKSIECFEKSLNIYQTTGNLRRQALPRFNIGELYLEMDMPKPAIKYFQEAYTIEKQLNDFNGMSSSLVFIGECYTKLGEYKKAIRYQLQGLDLAKKTGAKKDIADVYQLLAQQYERINDYKSAYMYSNAYSTMKDSIYNEEKTKKLTEMETKYETAKKEQKILLQEVQLAEKEAKVRQQAILKTAFIVFSILLGLLALTIFRSYRIKKSANAILEAQKEEITAQRDEIEAQHDLTQDQKQRIEQQQKLITDSIRYAQRIQRAILPPDDYLKKILPDHYIINLPRSIVSGDFYWAITKENKLYFAVGDCTGHGVPGGFMSMMGISFLNEIMNEAGDLQTNHILDLFRKYVIESLHQTEESIGLKDGLDIALCCYDQKKRILQFSGAFSPIFIFHNNIFTEVGGDKMPIGFYRSKEDAPFISHTIRIKKDTIIYLFTDGYMDQFGGPKGEKFKIKNFKSLLHEIHTLPSCEQKKILIEKHNKWKGEYDQIDDILIMGLKFS